MGSTSSKGEDKIEGEISLKDKSFMTSILQILFNIRELQEYFGPNNKFNKNKYLSYSLQILFQTRPSNIDWDEESEKIIKLLRKNYNLKMEITPGKELIQILMVLKYEEKDKLLPNWEENVSNNAQLINNLGNDKMALNDILTINRDNFDTILATNFFGILLTKRKLQSSNNIMHFYNFYCVYEMNLPAIYFNLVNKGKIMHNNSALPQLNLIDCIKEMQETKIQIYNNQPCYTEYYMFNAPNYLIFVLNNEENNLDTYRGHILFNEFMDFSNVILNTQINKFKIFAVIDSKRYIEKNKEENKGGVKWLSSKDEDNKKYRALIRNEMDEKFFYYDEENNNKNNNLIIVDEENFHNILIFSRMNN